jgi:hypothetical protein
MIDDVKISSDDEPAEAPPNPSTKTTACDEPIVEGNPANAQEATTARRRQRRSTRPYPPSSFEEAVEFAKDIYEFGSGGAVRKLTFFDHIKRSPDSSAARETITNANKYGLLKSSYASEQLELTLEALSIVGEKSGERERAKAKITLGIDRIDPFKQLYDRIAGTRLPQNRRL